MRPVRLFVLVLALVFLIDSEREAIDEVQAYTVEPREVIPISPPTVYRIELHDERHAHTPAHVAEG